MKSLYTIFTFPQRPLFVSFQWPSYIYVCYLFIYSYFILFSAEIDPVQAYKVANIGENVTLAMKELVMKDKTVLWLKNGTDDMLEWKNQVEVTIKNVTKHDQGVYECFYDGERSQSLHGIMRLIVRGKILCLLTDLVFLKLKNFCLRQNMQLEISFKTYYPAVNPFAMETGKSHFRDKMLFLLHAASLILATSFCRHKNAYNLNRISTTCS